MFLSCIVRQGEAAASTCAYCCVNVFRKTVVRVSTCSWTNGRDESTGYADKEISARHGSSVPQVKILGGRTISHQQRCSRCYRYVCGRNDSHEKNLVELLRSNEGRKRPNFDKFRPFCTILGMNSMSFASFVADES